MEQVYDVVVVGSGFGGAITATRLAQAGRSVCVLERGRRWDRREFPRSIGQVADHAMWRDGHSYGFVEYRVFRTMDVIQGAGVGGGRAGRTRNSRSAIVLLLSTLSKARNSRRCCPTASFSLSTSAVKEFGLFAHNIEDHEELVHRIFELLTA